MIGDVPYRESKLFCVVSFLYIIEILTQRSREIFIRAFFFQAALDFRRDHLHA